MFIRTIMIVALSAIALMLTGGCGSQNANPSADAATAAPKHDDQAKAKGDVQSADQPTSEVAATEGWEYAQEMDPITQEVAATAKALVSDASSRNLLAEVEFYCGPDQHLFGPPPYISIATYDKSATQGDKFGPASINTAIPLEFRFNSKKAMIEIDFLESLSMETGLGGTPHPFSNQVKVSFAALRFGVIARSLGTNPFSGHALVQAASDKSKIYVSNAEFALRLSTEIGALTHSMSLDAPAIRKVLEACGVVYGMAPEDMIPREFEGQFSWRAGVDTQPNHLVLKIDRVKEKDGILSFSGSHIYQSGDRMRAAGTIDLENHRVSIRESEASSVDAETDGLFAGTISTDLQTIEAEWTSHSTGDKGELKLEAKKKQ